MYSALTELNRIARWDAADNAFSLGSVTSQFLYMWRRRPGEIHCQWPVRGNINPAFAAMCDADGRYRFFVVEKEAT